MTRTEVTEMIIAAKRKKIELCGDRVLIIGAVTG